MMKSLWALVVICVTFKTAGATAEICGNGIDDDGNGLTDEGCYPTLTTGVCESPLSCGDTGMVSWGTGVLHYDLPPDVAPTVPYGPGIGFRRFATPSYAPSTAGPTSVNHKPLGPGWQHTYMTWMDAFTDAGGTKRVVLHTSQGRDVYYTYNHTTGVNDYYTPQAGDHVLQLYYDSSKSDYFLQLLTGEMLVYNGVGQIIEIWDTLPTPNRVSITWTSTTRGNVSTVTDASQHHRLSFSYTNNLLTSLTLQLNTGSKATPNWVTQHTTTYDYTINVSRDATSGWYVPANSTEWTTLLSGTGISNPTNEWGCQEASGNLADSIGSASLTHTSGTGLTYNASVTGWTRKALAFTDGSTSSFSSSSLCNPASSSCTALGLIAITANVSADRGVLAIGNNKGNNAEVAHITAGNTVKDLWKNTNSATDTHLIGSGVQPWVLSTSSSGSSTWAKGGASSAQPTYASTTSAAQFSFGGNIRTAAPAQYLYLVEWNGTALTTTQAATVIDRIENGPGILTKTTIGGQVAQQYTYTNGLLTKIADGGASGGIQVVAFSYSSTTPGQIDLISTSRGTVGFEYASSRSTCSGKSLLYFNQANTSSCSVDSDCGTGLLCGGKTGSGSTGKCFQAARCMTTSTANGEAVITNVTPIGGGASCTGACTDVAQYAWSSASGLVNAIGKQDPGATTSYTSIAYNSDGLPLQIGYGDTDTDPTNGGTNRTVYYTYDSTFRGRLIEIRRQSDISTSTCSSTVATGCAQTLYTYGSNNQLQTVRSKGFTLDSTGAQTPYDNTVTYVYDSAGLGRIAEIDGAVTNIKTTYDFFAADRGLPQDDFPNNVKIYTDATHYLNPVINNYDFWGHATELKDANGRFTCKVYDSARGTLTSTRRAMAGQTDCSTTNSADMTTSWARDSWLRLTQVTRPDGGCVFYTYDSSVGRPYQILRRDDCNSASSGDKQQFSYTADGQISEVDTYDASGTLTAKQPYTYYNSRRLQEIVNPADTSKYTGLVYDERGMLTEVDGGGSLSKTVNHYDSTPGRDRRVTSVDRYDSASVYDSWNLLYSWGGAQAQVTDGNSKVTTSKFDDLHRLVKFQTAETAYPTILLYDGAGRRTSMVELAGSTTPPTRNFTFDGLGRPLNDDYHDACTTGTPQAEIQRAYDAIPTGVTCPMAGGCTTNVAGRLAYVKVRLACDTSYTDGTLDQETFFAYDDIGRVIEEYVKDDTTRVADHFYAYSKAGLNYVTMPSGAVMGWTTDSGTSNSDKDLVTAMWRSSIVTPIATSIQWNPFGPWAQYSWLATGGGHGIHNRVARNLAYRITLVAGCELDGGSSINDAVMISEDAMGRVTKRAYSTPTVNPVHDSYFLYDQQSRVLCETTDLVSSCPTTAASDIKNSHSASPPFTSAGDWKYLLRPVPGSGGGQINNINTTGTTYGTTHQIGDVNQTDGTTVFGDTVMAYSVFGERTSDDNTSTLSHDDRTYKFDFRHNLKNVRGQYYTGSAWHYYDVSSTFDAKGRRVSKQFLDETTSKIANWFFYYDPMDRLTEIRYTPDTSAPATYSVFQLAWLGNKNILQWETDYPSVLTTKRYVTSDETDRPLELWDWPTSGDAQIEWAIDPSAWGFDTNAQDPLMFQPILFAGQYQDVETAAYENDGTTIHRPGLALNGFRTYDPFVGGYLQVDPLTDATWSSYVYATSNPVGREDILGLATYVGGDGNTYECSEYGSIDSSSIPGWGIWGHCSQTSHWRGWAGPNGGPNPGGSGGTGTGGGGTGGGLNCGGQLCNRYTPEPWESGECQTCQKTNCYGYTQIAGAFSCDSTSFPPKCSFSEPRVMRTPDENCLNVDIIGPCTVECNPELLY